MEKVFKSNGYEDAARVIDQALRTKKFTGRQKARLTKQRDDYRHERANQIESLMSMLGVNFAVHEDGVSNVETSAKYKVMDSLRSINEALEELEALDPDNTDVQAFRKTFDEILKKYKIKL